MKQPFHDDVFQGFNETNQYFEGWYFKQVSADEHTIISIIPGISKSKQDPHAFIQIFWVNRQGLKPTLKTDYVRFPIDEFKADKKRFDISIGHNHFSNEGIVLSLKGNRIPIQGTLTFHGQTSLPKSLYQPSIMGPFAYLPWMECYHGIVSMNHQLEGTFILDGHSVSFSKGKGYIEKDYGRSFPSAYVWIQANHFKESNASLFFSYATIPYLGLTFSGLICNWYMNGNHRRFATYNFSSIRESLLSPQHVQYVLTKGRHQLWIDAEIDAVVSLPSPKNGQMIHTIKEGLSGVVKVRYMEGKTIVYEGVSSHAGIEIMKGKKHG